MKIYFTILTALAVVVTATTIPPRIDNEEVIPSASVGNVEVAATVQEVKSDWIGDDVTVVDEEEDIGDEDDAELQDEDNDDADEKTGDEEEEGFVEDDYEFAEDPSQDGFEDNVPSAIHDAKDVIINRDNLLPILKTIVLAYTHKIKPSYTDMLKAGGISAFKTGFKFFGKEDLGISLLKMAKKLTNVLDDVKSDDIDTEILSQLAEDYLSSHKFKLVLPESVLLKQKEMDEFIATKDSVEGRSIVTNRQFDIAMPRADPAVQTILTIGPMTWMALVGGLFSIPWLLSGSDEQERVDHVVPHPSPYLRAPGLPFFQTHQLRRDEHEHVPHQPVDQEYLEYQKNYAEWYNNWYLKYKSYYDEHYPNHKQPLPQTFQPGQLGQQPQPLTSLDVMVPPPPAAALVKNPQQKPLHPPQKPLPPKHQLPKQPPQILFPQTPGVNARNAAAGAHVINTAENKQNSFGTFQSEKNKGDSHFRVFSGPEVLVDGTEPTLTTTPRTRAANPPSPQPVYIPTSESPAIESGFKPITKPNSPNVEKSTTSALDQKSEFKAPREETLLSKQSSSKPKTSGQPDTAEKTAGGFKPIAPPTDTKKQEVETSTLKVSGVTSGVFKTTPNPTSAPATTPRSKNDNISGGTSLDAITDRPAVFVRTATQKSVRVVTSSSFVVPKAAPLIASAPDSQDDLPDLKRPQRHQQSNPVPQHIPNQVKNEQSLPLHQRLPQNQQPQQPVHQPVHQPEQQTKSHFQLHQEPPLPLQQRPPQQPQQQQSLPLQQRPPQQTQQQHPLPLQQGPVQHQQFPPLARPQDQGIGFVRTNVPTTIQVVDHRPAQGFGLGPKPSTEPPTTTTPLPIYALDPFYGARLSRTDVIFHQLGVEEEGCREQVVCNIYKNPDVYTPFSDFLSRQLTVRLEELQKPKVSDERILRFFRYLKAAREGQNGSDCNAKYPECHFDTTSLSHKPIMNAFQKVSLLINAGSS